MSDKYLRCELKTWREFIDLLKEGKLRRSAVWRGQAERHRNLLPPIYREQYLEDFGKNELKTLRLFYEQSRGIVEDAQHLPVIVFPKKDDEYNKDKFFTSLEVVEWWSLARHYGLPTPFLDWTLYPLVALFMGLSGISPKDKKGDSYSVSIWSLDFPMIENDLDDLIYPIYEYSVVGSDVDVLPKDGVGLYFLKGNGIHNKRLVAQGGIFTCILPDEKNIETPKNQLYDVINFVKNECTSSTLREYVILFDSKVDINTCRMFLTRVGITPLRMFPDLKGVVDDCIYRMQSKDYIACPLPMTSRDVRQIMQRAKKK